MGEEENKCCGMTRSNRRCTKDVTGASYCIEHKDQESNDFEMPDAEDDYSEHSEDVEMGGM